MGRYLDWKLRSVKRIDNATIVVAAIYQGEEILDPEQQATVYRRTAKVQDLELYFHGSLSDEEVTSFLNGQLIALLPQRPAREPHPVQATVAINMQVPWLQRVLARLGL